MSTAVTVNDLLDGYVVLDVECLDRVYLNGYVPNLQVGGQVVSFMTGHLGYPIPSPAIMEKIGTRFRRAVTGFGEDNDLPIVGFNKGDRKIEVMRRYVDARAKTGQSGVAAIGVAQEYQNVFASTERQGSNGLPSFGFVKADRRVTCFYFYLWDVDFGAAFIKVCAYFPYPVKVWLNGHEWAKRQATQAGIGFTALSNGFATCGDSAALQKICDRLGPGTIEVFFARWMSRLPLPLTEADRAAGYWWELSMRQIEVCRTLVFDAPRPRVPPRTDANPRQRLGPLRSTSGTRRCPRGGTPASPAPYRNSASDVLAGAAAVTAFNRSNQPWPSAARRTQYGHNAAPSSTTVSR